jgi:hypothetical protein
MSNTTIDIDIRLRVWALLEAVEQGDIQEVQRLVDVEGVPFTGGHNFYGFTPLLYAAKGGHIPIMAWLLSKGSSLVEKDRWGKNAMHHAIEHNQIPALQYLLEVEGASIRGCDKHVNDNNEDIIITVWSAIAPCFKPKPGQYDEDNGGNIPEFDVPLPLALESLLKVMVMHENAPYAFRWGLPAGVFPRICELGRLNRPYLEQQRVVIMEGLPLSVVVLQQIVAEYARTSSEDMWAAGVVLSTGLPLFYEDEDEDAQFEAATARRKRLLTETARRKRMFAELRSVSPSLRRSQRVRNV